jgi:predicted ATP-dependent protease
MVTSIVSVLTQIPVRKDIAMTGEVTLRGNVLPIGGLKEKLLAALRGGITTVLIPQENEKDLPEIPDNVKEGLTIIPVSHVSEVLKHALVSKPEPSTGTRRPRRHGRNISNSAQRASRQRTIAEPESRKCHASATLRGQRGTVALKPGRSWCGALNASR